MKIQGNYREIWTISYPIIAGSLAQSINQIIDTTFLGRVSMEDLGASTLAGMFFVLTTMIAIGFTRGGQVIIARRTGAMDYEGVGKVFDHLLVICFILLLVLLFSIIVVGPWLIPFVVQSPIIQQKSQIYLQYRVWALPLLIPAYGFNAFFSGTGRTKVLTLATVCMALTNIGLDWILIFGKFGMPKMGIAGAALASSIAEWVYFGVYFAVFIGQKQHLKYPFLKIRTLDRSLINKMLSISTPIVGQLLFGLGSWAIFFLFIEKMGEKALAISGVMKSLYIFIGIPGWGMGSAANTVISNILGQGRKDDVIPVMKRFVYLSMAIGFSTVLIMGLFPRFILKLYTDEISIIDESLPVMYVTLAALLIFSISIIVFQSIVGIGATKITLMAEMVCVFLYMIYTYACVFIWKSSLAMAWGGELLYWVVMLILCLLYLRSGKWKQLNKL